MEKAIIVLSGLVLVISVFAGTTIADDQVPTVKSTWRSLGGDFKRAGLSDSNGIDLGCVKWKFDIEGAVSTSITIGVEDRVHIACEDGKLYTLDANGVPLWSYDANSPLISSPTIGSDGTVYVGSQNGKLYAIDINGNLQWTHDTDGSIYSSPALSQDGNVYVCSQNGKLYALGPDGSELWSFETKGPGVVPRGSIFASPAIGDDGTVYIVGLYDPNLYALEPNEGSLKWTCKLEYLIYPEHPEGPKESGWPFASPVIAKDGTIYQSLLYDSRLYAIEPNNGDIIWSTDLADPCSGWFDPNYSEEYGYADGWSEPALGPDGIIYVSFDDPYLRAVDPSGNIKWVTLLGDMGGFTLTVANNGLIYAAGDDGYLYVVDENGWEIARFQSSGWLNFPVISTNSSIIVSDSRDDSFFITDPNNAVWKIGLDGCDAQSFDLYWIEDLSADGAVDFIDFTLFTTDWLSCTDADWPCQYEGDETYLTGDIDRDRYVFFSDLATLADLWLRIERLDRAPRPPGTFGPPSGWPEPPKPPPKGRGCFIANTPVWIDGALVQISDVESGQMVTKLDCDPSILRLGQVEKVEEHEGIFECYDVTLETGDCITVVDSHYFLSDFGQWICIHDLKSGSRVQTLKGLVRINRFIKREKPFVGKCYNLKIKGTDHYFVGQEGVIARDW